ncbi:sodium:proton antiporter [Azotobacter chroococcum]|uniref:Sodium:proton antiporter n=1 Tax=Azotobacter chroococcum TaxID=353 RepID=A0AA43Z398_9GAMM|nr:sodium:proton antiporter [Azotobacter chroococcum]
MLVLGAEHILPFLESASAGHGSTDATGTVVAELRHHLGEISEILFFLLGAMTIVELIDAHEGFKVITDRIQTCKRVHLLWIIGFITLFLSSVLDNLTTTIVMVSLLRKLVRSRPERGLCVGMVVIAANAGGAWSPIGDVTTTMRWIATEIIHRHKNAEDKHPLSVVGVLRKVDTPSVLFFLGILLAVSSLATAGHLTQVATALRESPGNIYAINYAIGLLSAVVDNVPLVAGAMKMYPLAGEQALAAAASAESGWLSQFITDGTFWELLAFCAGTGGSTLIIGSAAGVAAMGMERIGVICYLKRISLLAFLGYSAGAATYIVLLALS